jgi:hypothetical protein
VAVVALVAALVAAIFVLNRRPPQQQQPLRVYTPGEQEILSQLAYIRDRLDKFIPPYGRVGYTPVERGRAGATPGVSLCQNRSR